ncbi:hypothetical protein F4604DRAFT_849093 [Suillus subluteus]|nr:hypothetical protein F4604DRAFT_849093 [Suillus subluteus]
MGPRKRNENEFATSSMFLQGIRFLKRIRFRFLASLCSLTSTTAPAVLCLLLPSVIETLRWASRMTTTRIEDIAYSLISRFDVSMPITYGEGQRSCFRLMEIILEQCKGWEIFVWAGELSPYSSAIPRSPKGYEAFDIQNSTELSENLDMGKVERIVGETPPDLHGDHVFAMTRHGLQMKLPLLERGV